MYILPNRIHIAAVFMSTLFIIYFYSAYIYTFDYPPLYHM